MTVDILGYYVTNADAAECASQALAWIDTGGSCRWAACINPHSYVVAKEHVDARAALKAADWLLPDGAGILLAARLLRRSIRRRVTGMDLFIEVHKALDRAGNKSVFYLGSTEDTLSRLESLVRARFPGVRIAGTYSPPFAAAFSPEENEAMLRAVNAARPDVLWVSMTAPKQEIWIHKNLTRFEARYAAAVGAVFDFYTGKVKRSHPLAQRLGLEWLPRLVREPRRLWRRTFVSAPLFLRDTVKAALLPAPAPNSDER